MNKEIFEIIIIAGIVIAQIRILTSTLKQIGIFRDLLPDINSFKIRKIEISKWVLQEISIQSLVEFIDEHPEQIKIAMTDFNNIIPSKTLALTSEVTTPVNIVYVNKTNRSFLFNKIHTSLNTYLLRNSSASTDFNLMRDIIERYSDTQEANINLRIPAPLYLGLLATVIGILLGLFSISFQDVDVIVDTGVKELLGGVRIAMIASAVGLIGLIWANNAMKNAKQVIEEKKNDLYSLIQTELLPVINQSLNATFSSLQSNLLKFNEDFKDNLGKLTGLFDKNFDMLSYQQKLLGEQLNFVDNIKSIDLEQLAKYNVTVFQEIQRSTDAFSTFNNYLKGLNKMVENSDSLLLKVNDLLERTENFEEIAGHLEGRLDESQALIKFLNTHFAGLELHSSEARQFVDKTNIALSKSLEELLQVTMKKIKAIEEIAIKEEDLLSKSLAENRTNLGKLAYLENLSKELTLIQKSTDSQSIIVQEEIKSLNKNLRIAVRLLSEMQKNNLLFQSKNAVKAVRNFMFTPTRNEKSGD